MRAQIDGRVMVLRDGMAGAEENSTRHDRMVEGGMTGLDEIPKGRRAALAKERHRTKAARERIHVAERRPADTQPAPIEPFGQPMRETVTTGETPFRTTRLQAIGLPHQTGPR